jgi:uncharacterized membrane protein required for colicin V production
MMSLSAVFWLFLVVFAIIGGFRGWAKEILVAFSIVTALAIDTMLIRFFPPVGNLLIEQSSTALYIRAAIVLTMAYFGYQTPNLPAFSGGGRFAREKLQDWLLGSIIGLLNGYLIVGTLWSYMSQAQYIGVEAFVSPPVDEAVIKYLQYMPPMLLQFPNIIFAVIIAFVFVIIVFV